MFRKQTGNLPALVTSPVTGQSYGPTFAQRAASKAVARMKERPVPAPREQAPNWEPYRQSYGPVTPDWVYDAQVVEPSKLPELVTTQMRLVGSHAALEKSVLALESAGFKVASVHYRKTRDVNDTDMILTATLIAHA